ncbi:MAG: UDP-N-acetylmuramoyl-L-alanine--D-glutamate ligase [Candidatus Omnitrophica bacterium]|nr:UDP-N-acetylmuramoyl-L-alanine--D-glutamate ligase [Candidatus Omnitrophota bacterium]
MALNKNSFKGKQVLVIGLGDSGFAAAKFLAERGAVVSVTEKNSGPTVLDMKTKLEKYAVRFEIGKHTKTFAQSAQIVIPSPGIDHNSAEFALIIPGGAVIIGELELAAIFNKSTVIAVTGTNGKSTVTSLIAHILNSSGKKAIACGNIGFPFVNAAETLTEKDYAVVEVSSFQLETIESFRPHVAILLNITEDHYERHKTFSNYVDSKFRIFQNQTKSDWAVLHSSVKEYLPKYELASNVCFYGDKEGVFIYENGKIIERSHAKNKIIAKTSEIPLLGRHNYENILSVLLALKAVGIGASEAVAAIKTFKALKHRFEVVGEIDGVRFIDDSKGTNIDATKQALISLDQKAVLIAGGRDKGGNYNVIRDIVKDKVKAIVVIGEAQDKIFSSFSDIVPVIRAVNLFEAVKTAKNNSEKNDVVLLSPMCSSYDMFKDYKERGDVFRRSVQTLMAEKAAIPAGKYKGEK